MNKENEIEIKKLKEIRNRLEISQVEVARELGVTKQYYNKVEKGLTSLSKDKAVELCKIFGISFEWFFGDGNHMLLKDEEINETFVQNMDNLNNLNKILKTYNIYLKSTFEIIKKNYPDANDDDNLATANILFNQDLINEKVSFTDRDETSRNVSSLKDFDTRVMFTYFPLQEQREYYKKKD